MSRRLYTLADGEISLGAAISPLPLKGAGTVIPAIIVGDEGRGRRLGVLPVRGLASVACPRRGQQATGWVERCRKCGAKMEKRIDPADPPYNYPWHPEAGVSWSEQISAASVSETRSGAPALVVDDSEVDDSAIILVLRSGMGFRGGNRHTGAVIGWKCGSYGCEAAGAEFLTPKRCPVSETHQSPVLVASPLPGRTLATGWIAQGDAGRMGSGEQLILLLPAGETIRASRFGRLYGAPRAHNITWDGNRLAVLTDAELCLMEDTA